MQVRSGPRTWRGRTEEYIKLCQMEKDQGSSAVGEGRATQKLLDPASRSRSRNIESQLSVCCSYLN